MHIVFVNKSIIKNDLSRLQFCPCNVIKIIQGSFKYCQVKINVQPVCKSDDLNMHFHSFDNCFKSSVHRNLCENNNFTSYILIFMTQLGMFKPYLVLTTVNNFFHDMAGFRGYKTFFMLNFLALSLSDVVFIMLINVKMPTIVGILTFMSRINFVLS